LTSETATFDPGFSRSEFACKCGCGFDTVDAELLAVLHRLRAHYGAPITIHSGCRCRAYNKRVGGAKRSQHMRARAADITVAGRVPSDVADLLDSWYPDDYGLGRYNTFTHIDTRAKRARWDLRK